MKKISTAHMLLVITLAVFMLTGIVMSLMPAEISMELPTWLTMSLGSIAILLPGLIYCFVKRIPVLQVIGLKKTRPLNFLMAALILVCAYPVIVTLNFLSMLFVENAVQDSMLSLLNTTNLPVMLFIVAVLPAISEEFVFRGILYNTYRKTAPMAGVILSAVFFALMHGNFNQIPYALFLGIVMALLMEATDSIAIPIFIHFLMNGSNVFISYAMKPVLFQSEMMSGFHMFGEPKSFLETLTETVGTDTLKLMIGIYAVIGLFFAAAVFALIYAVFVLNRRSLKETFFPENKQAFYGKRSGQETERAYFGGQSGESGFGCEQYNGETYAAYRGGVYEMEQEAPYQDEVKQPLFDLWVFAYVILILIHIFII